MPVDALPEFSPPYVEIQTEALGLSAPEVEQIVTIALEDLLNGVAWLDTIRSQSVPGLSSVQLIFEPGTDIMQARQLVQERLAAATLPNVARQPAMLQPLSSTNRFMMVGLSSQQLSGIDMSVLARWTVRPRLMGVPGVANVSVWGQRERQLQVQVDPKRLQAQGVSLNQVMQTTGNSLWVSSLSFVEASTPGTGGFIDTPNQRLGVQHVSPIVNAADLARVAVEDTKGKALRLGDVATVVEDHQPLIGDAVLEGGGGLMLVVEKFPNANTLEVTRNVEAALDALRPGMSGVSVNTNVFRPANFLELAIDNIRLALLLGAALVLLLLLLFSWRTALVAIIVLPLATASAALVMHWTGNTMNALVLAGLLLGLTVILDDVIAATSQAAHRLRAARAADAAADAGAQEASGVGSARVPAGVVVTALGEIYRPLLFATAILLVSVVPLFVLPGVAGALLPPLAGSFALAVLASLAVALTVTPALAVILGAPRAGTGSGLGSRAGRWLQRRHGRALSRVLTTPRPVLALAALLGVLALAALPALGRLAPPSFQERNLLLTFDGAPGTSRPEMNRIAAAASQELRALPGVSNVGAQVGRAILGDEVSGINAGQIWVGLAEDADYDETAARVSEVVDGYPGLEREVQTYSDDRIREVLADADEPVVVRLYGPEMATLQGKAQEVQAALSGVSGLVRPEVDLEPEEPQIEVEVNLGAAQSHGLKPGDVRRSAAVLLQGVEVGSLFEQQKIFEVVVRGVPGTGYSLTTVNDLMLDKPGGGQVRLGDVAQVRIGPTPTVLEREAVSSRLDVTAGIEGRDRGDVVAEVQQALRSVNFPLEYRAELLSGGDERAADVSRLVAVGLAVLVAVFLLLQAAFSSWALAAVVFLVLPVAVSGGLVGHLLSGQDEVETGAFVGLLAVLALAVRGVLPLVRRYQELERDGMRPGPDLVLRGTRDRVVPIVLSTLATVLLLLPFLLLGNEAGLEMLRPLAGTVTGGLVTTTFTSLVVVPALYLLVSQRRGARRSDGPATPPSDERELEPSPA